MALEMKVPSPGESITEVQIATWLKADGDYVFKDEEIVEVDSDKATLAIPAEVSGKLEIIAKEGDTINVGAVFCKIDTEAPAPEKTSEPEKKEEKPAAKTEEKTVTQETKTAGQEKTTTVANATPVAANIIAEKKINPGNIKGTGPNGRILKADVIQFLSNGINPESVQGWGGGREMEKKKMSMLRKKVAERLVSVKNETAMLTTFNEVDMTAILETRTKYKALFEKNHGIGLGFMSFFTKAVTEALNLFPAVNAQINGDELIYHHYADIGVAVSTEKGLMVPVIRNAETLNLAEIEMKIKELALKARDGKLSIEDMTGGTFTLTNGGVFGSLMSTPIINPPQVAILGMHKIQERPVVLNGQIVIRPMMYLALSYDHRIIDGKESVSFLVKVKEMLENPEKMIFGGKEPIEVLLGL